MRARKRSFVMLPFALAATLVSAMLIQAGAQERPFGGDWKTDFSRHSVPLDELVSGGPPKDGIPSIDDPRFARAAEVTSLGEREPLIRLEIDGDLRAYPLRIMTWHEIVNDEVGGVPVVVTYCPLCNSSVAFERRLDGQPVSFGTTGMLRHSDLVMYDRRTESFWQQFTGRAIVGEHTGKRLKKLPSRVVSFASFKEEAPQGLVLLPPEGARRPYGENPYVNYDTRERPFPFYRGDLPEDVPPMLRVVVLAEEEPAVAVSLGRLREKRSMQIGGVTLHWKPGLASALDDAEISKGREVGSVSAYDAGGEPVIHDLTFAFAFKAFHPEGKLITD